MTNLTIEDVNKSEEANEIEEAKETETEVAAEKLAGQLYAIGVIVSFLAGFLSAFIFDIEIQKLALLGVLVLFMYAAIVSIFMFTKIESRS